jgi:zinc protease
MNYRSSALLTLLLLACMQSALAQQVPPPPGPPRPFNLPIPTTITLPNGIEATFVDFGVVPKVTVAVSVRSGGLNEGDKLWLASLTGDLMKEGTTSRTSDQLTDAAAELGGEISIGTGDDETTLAMDVLSEFGDEAVGLLADVLTQPRLPESELPRLKQDYLRSLSVQLTQPQAIASAAFGELLYPAHPYGKSYPTPAQLKSYTIDDIRGFYENNFGARRTHIYVAGKFDRAAVEQAIRDHLGSWREGPATLELPPPPPGGAAVALIDRHGAPQSTIRVGLRVIDPAQPDFMALSVANTLLGGSLTSRITMNLREAKGWAYSPGSGLGTHYHQASWAESADVKAASTGPAITEIFKEVTRLRGEAPTEPELTAIKNYRNGIFVLSNATRGGLIGQLSFMNLQGLPADWLSTFVQRLYAVTPEQVTSAVQAHLDPQKMSVVVLGDMASVRPQLEAVKSLRKPLPKTQSAPK